MTTRKVAKASMRTSAQKTSNFLTDHQGFSLLEILVALLLASLIFFAIPSGDSAQKHREFYEEYMAVMDLPAEYYLQTIRVVFQEHLLPRGMMMHRDRPVKPEAIRRTALLTVEGERDDISGPGQTQATHELCVSLPASMQRDYVQPKVGHYGVFNGKRWHTEIAPRVRGFIREFDRPAG